MKVLCLIAALFLPIIIPVQAVANISQDIETIDLNLKEHELAVSFLGLSVGEATLIQGPDGENILVNMGANLDELANWLSFFKVKDIQKVVITSNEFLNLTQLKELISKYNIKVLIAHPVVLQKLTKNLGTSSGIVVKSWNAGMTEHLLADTLAEVQFSSANVDEGLDFTLQFYQHRLFLMTSLSHHAQQMLMGKKLGDINIFKVPLSAKKDEVEDQLILQINPEIAVLFAADKLHPNVETINDLQNTWTEVYYTKKHGTVTIKFTETNYEVFTIPAENKE